MIELSTGARVFVASKGGGDELVVFLHALGTDHTAWDKQIEALDPDRYTIAAYDLRGHCRSAFDVESSMVRDAVSISAFAKDTLALIEHLGFRRAHLVGNSLGGIVALEAFKRRSDMVQSLTLANSAPFFPDAESSAAWMQQRIAEMSLADSARELVPKMFAPDTPRELVDRAIDIEGAKSRHIYLASWNSMLQSDYRRMLEMIDVPVLLIGGSLDTFTPTDPILTSMQTSIATAELIDIAGASHYSNLDKPEEFNRALRTHLLRARSNESQSLGVASKRPRRIEGLTVAMAHGYWLMSGRVQPVLVHGNAGVANALPGIINASRARVPMLLMAIQPPPHDDENGRTHVVDWGQQSFDPAGPLREYLKWDATFQDETTIDRALAIAQSDPAGPVFLAVPRELASKALEVGDIRQQPCAPSEPSADAIERAARLIHAAQRPIVITGELGRHRGGPEALLQLAQRHAIPVIEHGRRTFFNFPTRHAMHLGFNPSPFVKQADAIIAIESAVPWLPAFANVGHRPKVVQIGVDPLQSRLPLSSFPSDVTLAGNPALTIRALTSLLDKSRPDRDKIAGRFAAFASEHRRVMQAAQTRAIADASKPTITKQFLSYCIGEAIDDRVVIFNEHGVDPQLVPRRLPDSWFESSLANVPGWSHGAAHGGQLAAPDLTMLVIATGRPPEINVPIMTIVINDGNPVSSPRELPAMLKGALNTVREQGKAVILDVRCVSD